MNQTFESVLTSFRAYLLTEKRCASNTTRSYCKDIEQFFAFLDKKEIALASVCQEQFHDFCQELYAVGTTTRTVARKISSIKLLFVYAEQRLGIANVAAELSFPKIEQSLPNFLTESEVQSLLAAACKGSSPSAVRNRVMVYLLYVTGMRISEMLSLTKDALRFDESLLIIKGKGNKQRVVPVPQPVMVMVQSYLADHYVPLTHGSNTDILFPVEYAGVIHAMSRQAFWKILNSVCRAAGIEKSVSPHQLRHSFATHMLKRGLDLRSLQLLLGHETIATVQIYTHLETSHLRSMYNKRHPRS